SSPYGRRTIPASWNCGAASGNWKPRSATTRRPGGHWPTCTTTCAATPARTTPPRSRSGTAWNGSAPDRPHHSTGFSGFGTPVVRPMDPSRVSAVGGGVAALLVLAAGGAPAGGVAFRGPVEGGGAFADAVHEVVGAGLLLLRV